MKRHITDEKTGISYTLHGDYYLLTSYYLSKLIRKVRMRDSLSEE